MKPSGSARTNLRTVAVLVLLGAVIGGYAGALECLLVGSSSGVVGRWGVAAVFAVTYAILWGTVGLLLGLVAMSLGAVRRRKPDHARRMPFYGTLLLSLVVFVLVGSYANVVHLPTMLSAQSLLFDAGLLAVCAVLWWLLFRATVRLLPRLQHRGAVRSPLLLSAVVLVVFLVVALSVPSGKTAAPSRQGSERVPELNILLIVVDALRADHLGCYGYERPVSPNIDGLAGGGVLFRSAYSHAPRTKESTASMLTSLYPPSHSMASLGSALPDDLTTLMEEMKASGYSTTVLSANPLVSPQFGFGRGVDFFYVNSPPIVSNSLLLRVSRMLTGKIGGLSWLPRFVRAAGLVVPGVEEERAFADPDAASLNESFLSWLDSDPGRFFAYLHYMEPHTPYAPPAPYDTLFADPDYRGPRMTQYPMGDSMMLPFVEGIEISDAERLDMVAQYDGSIAYFDRTLGALLEELEERELLETTAIILTSDHGEEFFDHSGWGHGQSLYQELIHVPLVVSCPRKIPGGRVIGERVRHVDLLPTLLGAAGMDETADAPRFEGINLWTILETGSNPPPDLEVYAEVSSGGHHAACLVADGLKLIHTRFGSAEDVSLFDLGSDPRERTNLSSIHSDVKESMLSRLFRMREGYASEARESEVQEIDDETIEKLRALGYVE